MFDVHKDIGEKIENYEEYPFINFWELLYADDTLIIGKSDKKVEEILHKIEEESLKYNMFLKKTKSVIICMNGICIINFKDGIAVEQVK